MRPSVAVGATLALLALAPGTALAQDPFAFAAETAAGAGVVASAVAGSAMAAAAEEADFARAFPGSAKGFAEATLAAALAADPRWPRCEDYLYANAGEYGLAGRFFYDQFVATFGWLYSAGWNGPVGTTRLYAAQTSANAGAFANGMAALEGSRLRDPDAAADALQASVDPWAVCWYRWSQGDGSVFLLGPAERASDFAEGLLQP